MGLTNCILLNLQMYMHHIQSTKTSLVKTVERQYPYNIRSSPPFVEWPNYLISLHGDHFIISTSSGTMKKITQPCSEETPCFAPGGVYK